MLGGIKSIRENKKLSQQELAKMLGVAQSTIAMWEVGQRSPRTSRLPQIAKTLGCSIEELYLLNIDKVG